MTLSVAHHKIWFVTNLRRGVSILEWDLICATHAFIISRCCRASSPLCNERCCLVRQTVNKIIKLFKWCHCSELRSCVSCEYYSNYSVSRLSSRNRKTNLMQIGKFLVGAVTAGLLCCFALRVMCAMRKLWALPGIALSFACKFNSFSCHSWLLFIHCLPLVCPICAFGMKWTHSARKQWMKTATKWNTFYKQMYAKRSAACERSFHWLVSRL